jgi:hypothetical protein
MSKGGSDNRRQMTAAFESPSCKKCGREEVRRIDEVRLTRAEFQTRLQVHG